MGLGEANQGLLDRLAGKEQVFLKNAEAMKQMGAALSAGRYAEVLERYDRLPRELQDVPVYMRHSVYAAAKVDEGRYKKAMDRYIRTFPDDPAGAVMAVDACFLRQDWEGVRRALEVVERRVGDDDGWIEVLRANVDIASGEYQRGMGHLGRALEREPGLAKVYPMAVGLALQQKDFAGVAKWLGAWEASGQKLADLSKAEAFQEFVASREGQAFLKRKPAR
jgi:tetratricopeptide (TPR) repeat protein